MIGPLTVLHALVVALIVGGRILHFFARSANLKIVVVRSYLVAGQLACICAIGHASREEYAMVGASICTAIGTLMCALASCPRSEATVSDDSSSLPQ